MAKRIANRDPARAALMGATPFRQGENSDFGQDFGFDDNMGTPPVFGRDQYYPRASFAADATPSPEAALSAWRSQHARRVDSMQREHILRPNDGSDVKIERYAFTMSQNITLGTAVALNINDNPATQMRPQRVTMSAPVMFFATVSILQVANVVVTVGNGVEDAFNYNAQGQGMALDMPTLSPSNRAVMQGNYTGLTPPGYVATTVVSFSVTFRGPSSIVA